MIYRMFSLCLLHLLLECFFNTKKENSEPKKHLSPESPEKDAQISDMQSNLSLSWVHSYSFFSSYQKYKMKIHTCIAGPCWISCGSTQNVQKINNILYWPPYNLVLLNTRTPDPATFLLAGLT